MPFQFVDNQPDVEGLALDATDHHHRDIRIVPANVRRAGSETNGELSIC